MFARARLSHSLDNSSGAQHIVDANNANDDDDDGGSIDNRAAYIYTYMYVYMR